MDKHFVFKQTGADCIEYKVQLIRERIIEGTIYMKEPLFQILFVIAVIGPSGWSYRQLF